MKKLYGVTAAMITPFQKDGEVDLNGMRQLTRMLVDKGIHCLYPCGTTGEMLRLSMEERMSIAECVVKEAGKRVPVFIHCGAMRQEETIALIKHACRIGADGAGVVTPQFFKASDGELIAYYEAAAEAAGDFPIYLYNIPQCSGNDISAETAKEIAERCPNVVGIKYSFADINRTIDYLKIQNRQFSVLHGCDRAMLGMLSLGCAGTVSGIAGVFPEPFVEAYGLYTQGRLTEAKKVQNLCIEFCDTLQCGSNMSYFKTALKLRGIEAGFMRKPQLNLDEAETRRLKEKLEILCSIGGFDLKISQ